MSAVCVECEIYGATVPAGPRHRSLCDRHARGVVCDACGWRWDQQHDRRHRAGMVACPSACDDDANDAGALFADGVLVARVTRIDLTA